MGLFDVFKGSKKSDANKRKESSFTSFIIQTDNVSQELHNAAIKYSISTAMLDFILLNYSTLVKVEQNSSDWTEIGLDEWSNYNKPETVLNPNFSVKQVYEIEIVKHKKEDWNKDLHLHIMTNKEKNKISAIFKAGSKLVETERLFDKLKNTIHKQMIKAGMLIDLWEVDYGNILNEICTQVRIDKQYIIPKDIKFDISICYPSVQPIDSKLILHYEHKNDTKDNDRVDYSKRGYVKAVEKDEVIIEYIKAKEGIPGRNCKGEFIPVPPPKDDEKPEFNISNSIEVIENDSKIVYKAKRGGYVALKDNTYDILDEMQIDEVSFKKTGSIDAKVDSEVKLHIHENDAIKDAIGTGLEVEAEEVKVEGSVGSSSKIIGKKIFIGGQTHQTSEIYAEDVKINVHKGFLKADTAEITRLEAGRVEAKYVKVGQAIGGEIKAMDIKIGRLGANVKAYAVSSISIDNIFGDNSKLIIDATEIPIYKKEIIEAKDALSKIEKKIEKIGEELMKLNKIREKSEPAIKTLKQKIMQDKAKGLKPQSSFIVKVKQFQQLIEKINEENRKIAELNEEKKNINTKLLTYQEIVLNAKIINKGVWKDYIEIEFHLLNPLQVVSYYPKAGEGNEEIYLKKIDDDFYEIATKKVEE